jgi:hypothetical protein
MPRKTPMWRRYLTFWGRNIERDVQDELEFHLDARARELIDQEWDPTAARTEARRRFGETAPIAAACHHIDRHLHRERRMTRYLADVVDDVRFACRQLRRQPRYFGLIALTLVVGIAMSTAFFAVVDGTLLKPLPYPEPDRLVRLTTWNLRVWRQRLESGGLRRGGRSAAARGILRLVPARTAGTIDRSHGRPAVRVAHAHRAATCPYANSVTSIARLIAS